MVCIVLFAVSIRCAVFIGFRIVLIFLFVRIVCRIGRVGVIIACRVVVVRNVVVRIIGRIGVVTIVVRLGIAGIVVRISIVGIITGLRITRIIGRVCVIVCCIGVAV